jgi:DNA repair protein RecN (Recombination protein N)
MLKSIYIDNYALIEKLEIHFNGGLSIVTGETGAGKTILLGALSLLLGKRADTSILKDTERKCVVEGEFSIEGYGLEPFFAEHELEFHIDTIIRREIASNGKSRAFINDTPVNLDILQELSLFLIDIHSQHQNLLLNNDKYLKWIIDSYAGTIGLAEEFRKHYLEFSRLKKEYEVARDAYNNDQQDLEYITHQFTELSEAKLIEGELMQLEQEFDILNHAGEIKLGFDNCSQLLQSEQGGVVRDIKQVLDLLSKIKNHFPAAEDTLKRIESAYIELKDLTAEIESFNEKVEFDPLRAEQVSQRIETLYNLLRKFKVNTDKELIETRDRLDKKIQEHASGDIELEKMLKALTLKEKLIEEKSAQLSSARQKVFKEFENKVASLLQILGMPHAGFAVSWQQVVISESGADSIEFIFSSNKSIALQNIARIASGGELSRLMLTIKYLISNSSGLPTIIFDEIDTGVSGEIADKVGNLIKTMSEYMQVINITHLPQVASKGERHYLVYKENSNGTVNTYIRLLSEIERVHEIAKMLSGDSVTEAAIENARVLLRK